MPNEVQTDALKTIRALVSWYDAMPGEISDHAADAVSETIGVSIDGIVAWDDALFAAYEAEKEDDEADEFSTDFWDRVEARLS